MKNISFDKMSRLAIIFVLIGANDIAYADEITLCQSFEEVYFSCPTGKKIISLCASGNISPGNGYVQYRFGTLNHIELQFPESPYPPKNKFSISNIPAGSLHFLHVKFESGGYDYVVYQGAPGGIYVKKDGKLISNNVCQQGIYQQLSPRAYRGIRTVAPVDGVDN